MCCRNYQDKYEKSLQSAWKKLQEKRPKKEDMNETKGEKKSPEEKKREMEDDLLNDLKQRLPVCYWKNEDKNKTNESKNVWQAGLRDGCTLFFWPIGCYD